MMSAIGAGTVVSIISYIMQDTCISVAHVSSRLRSDTFFISYFLLKMVLVMNEFHCHKKVATYLTKTLK